MTDTLLDPALHPPDGEPTDGGRPRDERGPARPLARRLAPPFAFAFVLQLVLVLGDRMPGIDALAYFESGRNVLAGRGYVRYGLPELHFPPVTPLAFATLERVLGSEMAALRTWNLAWGLATVAVLVALARTLAPDDDDVAVATAWLAPLVAGLTAIAIDGGGGSELPALCFLLSAAIVALRSPSGARRAAAAGALVALAYLTRPEALLPGLAVGAGVAILAASRTRGRPPLRAAGRALAGFAAALVVLVTPYALVRADLGGSPVATSKAQDASIESWRAIAEGDRLERDRVLYEIQPDGITLGPDTVPLTRLARQDPEGWAEIVGINARTVRGLYLDRITPEGPVWTLLPLVLLLPALVMVARSRRLAATRLLVAMAAINLATALAFFALPRYLMLTTAILVPFGAWGLVLVARRLPRPTRPVAWAAVAWLCATSLLAGAQHLVPDAEEPEHTEQRTAGEWIAEHAPEGARVLTRSYYVQAYAERPVVAWPSADWPETLAFARRLGVDYVVADESTTRIRRPEVFRTFFKSDEAPDGLRLVHSFTERDRTVRIYVLDPAAGPTLEAPIPLGYVSD